jgi:hypothetical protein
MWRLQRVGIRGFYFMGNSSKEWFLHVMEAAYLCTILPSTRFPHGPRDSLCPTGQCAAPMQALWIATSWTILCKKFMDLHNKHC